MHAFNMNVRFPEEPLNERPTYLFNDWRGHGQQVAVLARDIGEALGLSDGAAARVEKAARYHDIGKSRLPNLFDDPERRPEGLSRSERELVMSHTWLGYRILQTWPNPDAWVADAALMHHEWWNGKGYPLGLARAEIPLVARIVAVADAYSALLEQRPYASAWHVEDALMEIETKAGAQFDPECVAALITLTRPSESTVSHARVAANALPN